MTQFAGFGHRTKKVATLLIQFVNKPIVLCPRAEELPLLVEEI